MTTPEERRAANIEGMTLYYTPSVDLDGLLEEQDYYDALLRHFDEHEPKVAEFIRFGAVEHSCCDTETFQVDVPEGHPKR